MTKQEFLVMPNVTDALVEETKPKLLVLCVDQMGTPCLWLAPRQVEDSPHRANLWNETALNALAKSETMWVRMTSNMAEGAYTIHTSNSLTEPKWPELPMSELIKLGFGEERVIRNMNHPLVRRLLGRD